MIHKVGTHALHESTMNFCNVVIPARNNVQNMKRTTLACDTIEVLPCYRMPTKSHTVAGYYALSFQ